MDYLKKSRIEEVLIAILGKGAVTSRLLSRIEKILDAIRTDGSHDGPVMSEVEGILVCILLGKRFEKPTHSRIADMLKVKANGGEYTELRKSRVEELIFEWINAVESATYTGTLPTTLQTVAGYLESYKIYGNTEQTGTPTPENPIMPSGCGEMVDITGLNEPLCGIGTYTDSLELSTGILTRRVKKRNVTIKYVMKLPNGNTGAVTDNFISPAIPSPNSKCNIAPYGTQTVGSFYINSNNAVFVCAPGTTFSEARVLLSGAVIWYILAKPEVSTIPVPSGLTGTIDGYLIQDGTPTPETPIYPTANGVKQADGTYSIPYGYKLPILSDSTATDIYLGEVATTRYIKKYECTGKENWQSYSDSAGAYGAWQFYANDLVNGAARTSVSSNIAEYGVTTETRSRYPYGAYLVTGGAGIAFQMAGAKDVYTGVSAWKSYLAAQYANGTPVTVWYILAEPETSIVNEPLMKIGDYADTVSMEQAGVSIPTAAGTTVIDYNGTPKPEKVELTYSKPKIKSK